MNGNVSSTVRLCNGVVQVLTSIVRFYYKMKPREESRERLNRIRGIILKVKR